MTQDPPSPDGTEASYSVGSVANGHMWTGSNWVPLREAPPPPPGATPVYEPGMVANGFVWTGLAWSALPTPNPGPAPAAAGGSQAGHRHSTKPLWRRWWVLAIAALVVLAAIGQFAKPNSAKTVSSETSPSQSTTPTGPTSEAPSSPAASTAADPEANPTNTASISTAGLTPAGVLYGTKHACRTGNPLANVYHPYRLQVVTPCSTVSGVVQSVTHEDDGDYHIDLALDAPYKGMIDAGNVTYQHGWLVLEIVPADEPGCVVGQPPRPTVGTYNYGICTGADEVPPSLGQHIWVTGPYVIDHWHNWAEIHPVWSISTTQPATSAPAPPPPAPKPSPTHAPTTLRCTAAVSNSSPAQYSTVDVLVATAAGAQVSATAHYASKDTTNVGTADGSGAADLPFRISRAALGFQVVVDVTVTLGSQSATCSTSFTPQ